MNPAKYNSGIKAAPMLKRFLNTPRKTEKEKERSEANGASTNQGEAEDAVST